MDSFEEIRQALQRLSGSDRRLIEVWLRGLEPEVVTEWQVQEALPSYVATDPAFMTLEEYFAFEEKSPWKHEFVNGVVFAMNGVSVAHAAITQNLVMAFGAHLKRGSCKVFSSNLQVLIQRDVNEMTYYPDVVVDCRSDTRGTHYLRDPKLIVEVLSPSTQLIDRREKLQNYRLIDSVEEYVLVAQEEHRVTVYPRAERWKPRVYCESNAAVHLRSIGLTLSLNEVYADVLLG
ncbi:MAG TPA: Uma2 family endonuclease [Steroidobacteraceae bacterium]|nr:Uma2 family endonuclease [Steroidobacteraceae bacterium]